MRALVAALSLVAVGLLGAPCGPPSGGGPAAQVYLSPGVADLTPGETIDVDVVVNVGKGTVQAFEIGLRMDPAVLVPLSAAPHLLFDEDGTLFGAPVFDAAAGTVTGIVDLRHGDALDGIFRIATVRLQAVQAGSSFVTFEGGGLASPVGADFQLTAINSLFTVTSP